jgi:hypothetical protein
VTTPATELDRICAHVPFHDADPAQRAAVLRRLADTELHAALVAEPAGDRAELRMFDLPGGAVALASDDAAALAEFLGGPIAHVSLPGRVLARELAEAGRGLLVNPGRPSEMLLDAAALGWLIAALAEAPEAGEAAPRRLAAPSPEAVETLAEPLATRLADMAGMVAGAALVGVEWSDGREGHLVVVAGAGHDDRAAIAKALAELIAFLPPVEGGVDVTFEDLPLPQGSVRIEAAAVAPEPARPKKPDAPPRLRW